MAKQHATTLRSKTYSMGKLANVIWGDDWDVEYFVNNSTNMPFGKLIHDMYDPNPKAQRIVQHVVHTLMGLYTIGLHLKNVIEGSHKYFVVTKYGIWCNLYDLKK
jgi:hypothetical protein